MFLKSKLPYRTLSLITGIHTTTLWRIAQGRVVPTLDHYITLVKYGYLEEIKITKISLEKREHLEKRCSTIRRENERKRKPTSSFRMGA